MNRDTLELPKWYMKKIRQAAREGYELGKRNDELMALNDELRDGLTQIREEQWDD